MNELFAMLGTVDWIYIISATILMMLIGMMWYADWAFGKTYFAWMGMQDADGDGIKDGMAGTMALEALSRFFIASGVYLFLSTGGDITNDWYIGLGFILMLYVLFIAPTTLSNTVRSNAANKQVFWITAGAQFVGIVASVWLYYLFQFLR